MFTFFFPLKTTLTIQRRLLGFLLQFQLAPHALVYITPQLQAQSKTRVFGTHMLLYMCSSSKYVFSKYFFLYAILLLLVIGKQTRIITYVHKKCTYVMYTKQTKIPINSCFCHIIHTHMVQRTGGLRDKYVCMCVYTHTIHTDAIPIHIQKKMFFVWFHSFLGGVPLHSTFFLGVWREAYSSTRRSTCVCVCVCVCGVCVVNQVQKQW